MAVDRNLANVVLKEVRQAAEEIAKKHGLKVFHVNGSYADIETSVRVKFRVTDAQAIGENKEKNFADYAPLVGLKPGDLHKQIVIHGKTFTIESINPRKSKNSVEIKNTANGKIYLTTPETAIRCLGRKVEPMFGSSEVKQPWE